MSRAGVDDQLIASRRALLDALDALEAHSSALIVVGAQAVYLRTGEVSVALAPATRDSDLAIDRDQLGDDPTIERALTDAGFHRSPTAPQPGAWLSRDGVPVDLMIPEAMAGGPGRRAARVPPHADGAIRRARGLEASVVDNSSEEIAALDPRDDRANTVAVAGIAALLIAKLHKLRDRRAGSPERLQDKDAHDVYRLMVASHADELADSLNVLLTSAIAGEVTRDGLRALDDLFCQSGAESTGAVMAGRAEELVGEPAVVAAASAALAADIRAALGSEWPGG